MPTEHDLDILARTILGEARGEPFEGKVAVGRTVVTRWKSRRWFAGKTIAGTAQKPWQYSCWNAGDPNRAKILAVQNDTPIYQECLKAAVAAVFEEGPAWLAGCTHYYAPKVIAAPDWAKGKTPAGEIGGHVFFKGID